MERSQRGVGLGPVTPGSPMTRGAVIAFAAPYVPGPAGVGALGEGYTAEGETACPHSLPRQARRDAILMERLIH